MKWPWTKVSDPHLKPELSESHLKPGTCECTHNRSTHKNGTGECHGQFVPDDETPEWTSCSCQIYIRDDDDDNSDDPETPTPEQLEKLFSV